MRGVSRYSAREPRHDTLGVGFLSHVPFPAPESRPEALYVSLQSCRVTIHVSSHMAVLPAQLHVKLSTNDSKLLTRLAKKAKLSISETIRQLIRNSKVASTP